MNIGDVSDLSGLPAKAIRYYEDIGLLKPGRAGNAYRDIHRQRFLQRARSLGFAVKECRQLLSPYSDSERAISRNESSSRKCQRRITLSNAMSITPMSPALIIQGWVQTWVTSQWKNPSIPGQFSAEINRSQPSTGSSGGRAASLSKSSPSCRKVPGMIGTKFVSRLHAIIGRSPYWGPPFTIRADLGVSRGLPSARW